MSVDEGSKPFANTFRKQLELVTDLSWIDMDHIESTAEDIRSVLGSSMHISDERTDAVAESFMTRARAIGRMTADHRPPANR